jgi:hypothetical protein
VALRPHHFKRVVLGLHPGTPDRTVRLAVELAELLEIDLLGLVLEDNLGHLAGSPFARELRLPGGDWRPIDLDRLTHELDLASRDIRRRFTEAAERLSPQHRFELIRGSALETIAAVAQAGDILVVGEPANPADRATHQFASLMEAALRAGPAAIFVPTRIARTSGPVVAIASGDDDASITAAAAIAMAAKEPLIIIGTADGDETHVDELASQTGLRIKRVTVGKNAPSDLRPLLHALHQFQERLIVATRGDGAHERATALAAACHTPVLLVEPTETKRSHQQLDLAKRS